MKVAVFPGSFDPITHAHVDVVKRATPLFDKIYVAIGVNTSKKGLFTHEERLDMVAAAFAELQDAVEVVRFEGLTVDFCKKVGARYILRGMRNVGDFEFEKAIAQNNADLAPDIETVFLVSSSGLSHISSTIIREIIANNGDVSRLVPNAVVNALINRSRQEGRG